MCLTTPTEEFLCGEYSLTLADGKKYVKKAFKSSLWEGEDGVGVFNGFLSPIACGVFCVSWRAMEEWKKRRKGG